MRRVSREVRVDPLLDGVFWALLLGQSAAIERYEKAAEEIRGEALPVARRLAARGQLPPPWRAPSWSASAMTGVWHGRVSNRFEWIIVILIVVEIVMAVFKVLGETHGRGAAPGARSSPRRKRSRGVARSAAAGEAGADPLHDVQEEVLCRPSPTTGR